MDQDPKKTMEMGNEILSLGKVASIIEKEGPQKEDYFKAGEEKPRPLIEARRKTENEDSCFEESREENCLPSTGMSAELERYREHWMRYLAFLLTTPLEDRHIAPIIVPFSYKDRVDRTNWLLGSRHFFTAEHLQACIGREATQCDNQH